MKKTVVRGLFFGTILLVLICCSHAIIREEVKSTLISQKEITEQTFDACVRDPYFDPKIAEPLAEDFCAGKPKIEERFKKGNYRFSLNRKPLDAIIIPVYGTEANPQPGDLLEIGNSYTLILGQPGDYDFDSTDGQPEVLTRRTGEGTCKIVGAYFDSREIPADGWNGAMEKVCPKENCHLKTLSLDWERARKELLVDHLPLDTCIYIDNNETGFDGEFIAEFLPPDRKCLIFEHSASPLVASYEGLKSQKQLEYLSFDATLLDEQPSAGVFAGLSELKWFKYDSDNEEENHLLSALTKIRHLDLHHNYELTDISFVKTMKNLRYINISKTAVKDLSFLFDLQNLIDINANSTRWLEKLPEGKIPEKQNWSLVGSYVPRENYKNFFPDEEESESTAAVAVDYQGTLDSTLKGITKVVVERTYTMKEDQEKFITETKSKREINKLIKNIKIDESFTGFHCMCSGDVVFTFYNGNKEVTAITFHHGEK